MQGLINLKFVHYENVIISSKFFILVQRQVKILFMQLRMKNALQNCVPLEL